MNGINYENLGGGLFPIARRGDFSAKCKHGARRAAARPIFSFVPVFDSLFNGEIRVSKLALDLDKRTIFDFRWNVAGPMGVEITLPKNAPAKFAYPLNFKMRIAQFRIGPGVLNSALISCAT